MKALKSGQLLDFDNIEFYPSGEGLTPYEVENYATFAYKRSGCR